MRSGDRRGAAQRLSSALAAGPDDRAAQWRADLRQISSHWHGDAWLFRRNGSGTPALGVGVPSLGGSQLGGRIDYLPTPLAARPLLIGARIARPLSAPGSSATQLAAGIGIRPLPGLPVRVTAERLIATGKGARDAWALRVEGGSTVALPQGFRLDSYGQAGVIGLNNRDGFADGAAQLVRPINPHVDIRGGLWASAQPGARRLDTGPGVAAHARAGGTDLTAALDWRIRLAGNARPDSGPTFTLAVGF